MDSSAEMVDNMDIHEPLEDIPKPQQKFEPKVNNDESTLFIPVIIRKFNAVVPLEGSPKEHPYLPEINAFEYLPEQFKVALEPYVFDIKMEI
jgi:hypothetical protein